MSLVADMPHPFANSQSTPPPSPSASTISSSNMREIENRETIFAAQLITAVEKFVENKLSDNRPAGTENPDVKGIKSYAGRATTLAYKHVKETIIKHLNTRSLRITNPVSEISTSLYLLPETESAS